MEKDTAKKDIEIGKRIRERRTDLKMSQEKLGTELGVNKSTIQRYESQGVDPDKTMVLSSISDALGTTIDWLKGETEEIEDVGFTTDKLNLEKSVQDFIACSSKVVNGANAGIFVDYLKHFIDTLSVYNLFYEKAVERFKGIDSDEMITTVIDKYDIQRNLFVNNIYQKEVKDVITLLHYLVDSLYYMFDEENDGMLRFFESSKVAEHAKKLYDEKYNSQSE